MKYWCFILMLFIAPLSGSAQLVDKTGVRKFLLSDKTEVTLLPGFDSGSGHLYYYLPSNLRLATQDNNAPAFSLLTYKNENESEVAGSIFNFLILWGLTRTQEKELTHKLSEADSLGVIAGSVPLEITPDKKSFVIYGQNEFATLLRNKLNLQPEAPVLPETKIALSYRFNGPETKIIESGLADPQKLCEAGIELTYLIRSGYSQNAKNPNYGEYITLRKSFKELFEPISSSKSPSD